MKFFLRFISPVKNYPPCLHANPAAAVARVHVVSVLTRSRPARCIQPVKGLRCGFGVALASSALRRVFVAASIAATLLTTESLVADKPQPPAPAAPAAPDMGGMY